MKKALLVVSMIAALSFAACSKKEEPVVAAPPAAAPATPVTPAPAPMAAGSEAGTSVGAANMAASAADTSAAAAASAAATSAMEAASARWKLLRARPSKSPPLRKSRPRAAFLMGRAETDARRGRGLQSMPIQPNPCSGSAMTSSCRSALQRAASAARASAGRLFCSTGARRSRAAAASGRAREQLGRGVVVEMAERPPMRSFSQRG